MSLKQKSNKHLKTKSVRKTGTAGSRARQRTRLQHGTGKGVVRSNSKKGRK